MDRSLDEIVAERQRSSNRGGRRGGPPPPRRNGGNSYPRDGVRKPTRDDRANLDNDWVHDRYDDDPGMPRGGGNYNRQRGRRDDRDDRNDDRERDREPPVAKIRVDNLHYDLTEDDLFELFTRIGSVVDVKLRYDRAGRSEGVAFVSYRRTKDAQDAIDEFDGANAKGQPIRLTLLPQPRRDNPFDRVENPRSLFDRIEAPRDRRRSESPIPGSGGSVPRSDSSRGGRRPGERRERRGRGDEVGSKMSGGRPRKTQEELDAEMEDYWGGNANENGQTGGSVPTGATAPAPQVADGGAEMDMMVE